MRELDRTASVPKSVLHYELDKVRSLDLETSLSQSCSPKHESSGTKCQVNTLQTCAWYVFVGIYYHMLKQTIWLQLSFLILIGSRAPAPALPSKPSFLDNLETCLKLVLLNYITGWNLINTRKTGSFAFFYTWNFLFYFNKLASLISFFLSACKFLK